MSLTSCPNCFTFEEGLNKNGLIECVKCKAVIEIGMGFNEYNINEKSIYNDKKIIMKDKKKNTSNTLSHSYSFLWQNVNSYIKNYNEFEKLDQNDLDLLINKTVDILYHCSLIWSGKYIGKKVSGSNIQLPKDCVLRICATIVFVIRSNIELLKKIECIALIRHFFHYCKSKKGLQSFETGIYNFMSLIQEYKLDSIDFSDIKYQDLDKSGNQEDNSSVLNQKEFISTVSTYENLFKVFFLNNDKYLNLESESFELYKNNMYNVVLEGKGPRITMAVSIYFIGLKSKFNCLNDFKLFLKNKILDNGNKSEKKSNNSRKKRKINNKINVISEIDDINFLEYSTTLFNDLLTYFLGRLNKDNASHNRQKQRFLRCVQKFIELFLNY